MWYTKAKIVKCLARQSKLLLLLFLITILMVCLRSGGKTVRLKRNAISSIDSVWRNVYFQSKNLTHYINNSAILIEPLNPPCPPIQGVPLIIMVASSAENKLKRQAVRATWAKYQPTYFVVGLYEHKINSISLKYSLLPDNLIEAETYNDVIVFDFWDSYQNLTIKTALLINWALTRCPQAEFMMKSDDDMLINPWTLKTVLKENDDAELMGHKHTEVWLERDKYHKYYVPYWLYEDDFIPQYLGGNAYVIRGKYLSIIIKKACELRLMNIEDIFFTYIVSAKNLGLTLRNDIRFCANKPKHKIPCLLWGTATSHNYSPKEMMKAWSIIESMSNQENRQCDNVLFLYKLILFT